MSVSVTVVLGLACYYAVELARKLPPMERWTLAGLRPWACHICISFWASAMAHTLLFFFNPIMSGAAVWVISTFAVAGVTLLALYVSDALGASKEFELPGES